MQSVLVFLIQCLLVPTALVFAAGVDVSVNVVNNNNNHNSNVNGDAGTLDPTPTSTSTPAPSTGSTGTSGYKVQLAESLGGLCFSGVPDYAMIFRECDNAPMFAQMSRYNGVYMQDVKTKTCWTVQYLTEAGDCYSETGGFVTLAKCDKGVMQEWQVYGNGGRVVFKASGVSRVTGTDLCLAMGWTENGVAARGFPARVLPCNLDTTDIDAEGNTQAFERVY